LQIYLVGVLIYLFFLKRKIIYLWPIIIVLALNLFFWISFSAGQIDKQIRVALIQPNIPMNVPDWKIKKNEYLAVYAKMALQASKDNPDLIIFPETAIGVSLRQDRDAARQIRDIIDRSSCSLLLGNVDEFLFSLKYRERYNSAYFIDKQGVVAGEHYKSRLVPFLESGAYRQGKTGPLTIPGFTGYKAAVIICFEALFPDTVSKISKDANIIFNLSSDGWSDSLAEHQLNLSFNVFRAVENRLYLVRVSDNGISAVISPRGEILETIPAFVSGVKVVTVPLLSKHQ